MIHRSPPAIFPDPYKPGSPGYEERHRETRRELGNGIVRVDVGAAVEPARRKPRRSGTEPTAAPPEIVPPEPRPSTLGVPAGDRDGKQWGLNRDA